MKKRTAQLMRKYLKCIVSFFDTIINPTLKHIESVPANLNIWQPDKASVHFSHILISS
jgi:hypothetical protein